MVLRILCFLFTGITALGADPDPWSKVRELKRGVELRIFKTGAKAPLLAQMDELAAESLVVVLKKEQVAIPKHEIERIDYRPAQPGGRVKTETKTTVEGRDPKIVNPSASTRPLGASSSTSTSVSVGSKPDFETIYRRTAGPQK